jgi:hypothetical protein
MAVHSTQIELHKGTQAKLHESLCIHSFTLFYVQMYISLYSSSNSTYPSYPKFMSCYKTLQFPPTHMTLIKIKRTNLQIYKNICYNIRVRDN